MLFVVVGQQEVPSAAHVVSRMRPLVASRPTVARIVSKSLEPSFSSYTESRILLAFSEIGHPAHVALCKLK
jgi:hypothetical protein